MELFSTETIGILLGVANLIVSIVSPKIIFQSIWNLATKPFKLALSEIRKPTEHDIALAKAVEHLGSLVEKQEIRMVTLENKLEEYSIISMHTPGKEKFRDYKYH